jgi:hypothetical protein
VDGGFLWGRLSAHWGSLTCAPPLAAAPLRSTRLRAARRPALGGRAPRLCATPADVGVAKDDEAAGERLVLVDHRLLHRLDGHRRGEPEGSSEAVKVIRQQRARDAPGDPLFASGGILALELARALPVPGKAVDLSLP